MNFYLFKNSKLLFYFLFSISFVFICSYKFGIIITPDSINYYTTAQNFIKTGELIEFSGNYYVHWPPLYVLILAFGVFFKINIFIWAICVNCIVLFLSLKTISKFLEIINQYYTFSQEVIFSIIILMVFPYCTLFYLSLLSESLFLLFMLNFMYHFNLLAGNNTFKQEVLCSVFLLFMVSTRYVGILFLGVSFFIIFLFFKGNLIKKVKLVFKLLFPSILFLICWEFRNYNVCQSIFPGHDLLTNLNYNNLLKLKIFVENNSFEFILSIIALISIIYFSVKYNTTMLTKIILCIVFIYSLGIVIQFRTSDGIKELARYLSILIPICVILIFQAKINKTVNYLLVVITLFSICIVIYKNNSSGIGYNNLKWQNEKKIIRTNSVTKNLIFSNHISFLYMNGLKTKGGISNHYLEKYKLTNENKTAIIFRNELDKNGQLFVNYINTNFETVDSQIVSENTIIINFK